MIDRALLLLARALLHACSPETTHDIMRHVGALFPARRSRQEVAAAWARLKNRGSCLSRSLAVAARAPPTEVVIGVTAGGHPAAFGAHAWLELEGQALYPEDPQGLEIARLRSRPGRRGRRP
jgi:Transglutaminase-like superfamily